MQNSAKKTVIAGIVVCATSLSANAIEQQGSLTPLMTDEISANAGLKGLKEIPIDANIEVAECVTECPQRRKRSPFRWFWELIGIDEANDEKFS